MTPLAEKLEALRRHAASARKLGNVAEADAFERAALRIEAKLPAETHTPATHAAQAALAEDADALFWTDLPMGAWPWTLAVRIGEAMGIETIAHDTREPDDVFYAAEDKPGRWRASFFGPKEACFHARVLFTEVRDTLRAVMASRTFRSDREKRSFAIGFVDTVGKMLLPRDPADRAAVRLRRRLAQKEAARFATRLRSEVRPDARAYREGESEGRAARRR